MDDLGRVIGLFFLLAGVLLLTGLRARAPLTTVPVNLYVGVVMIGFGIAMLALSARRRRTR